MLRRSPVVNAHLPIRTITAITGKYKVLRPIAWRPYTSSDPPLSHAGRNGREMEYLDPFEDPSVSKVSHLSF
jgi:hypothetical protein